MTERSWSVAFTGDRHDSLAAHLIRADRQEDVCFATYRPSTGVRRTTALIREVLLPQDGERLVHGTASFTTPYLLRAAERAAESQCGIVALHSHPLGSGWQAVSCTDQKTEASYANLAREVTGLPLVGMTLAGDERWSARAWDDGVGRDVSATDCENVRVIRDDRIVVSWNDELRPPPISQRSQIRTVHCWGDAVQADLARLRVLVVGPGSVGLTVAIALAATGIEHVGVMDYDTVKFVNLDRMLGASPLDAYVARSKTDLAQRLAEEASTAANFKTDAWQDSVCEPAGFAHVLDFDVVFSCVDRPWPRYVLNTAAYADLIPVIDGGIHVDPFVRGGMRGAMWRSHVVAPGRICLACNRQFHPSQVALERDGSLDDPSYINMLPEDHPLRVSQNVAALSVNQAGALLAQFVSLVVVPGGIGDPGPLRYQLANHLLQHDAKNTCIAGCPYPASVADGDLRFDPTGRHAAAELERATRARAQREPRVRVVRAVEDITLSLRRRLINVARRSLA
jgi:molybdopterin-synthase adenylyltransferase